MLATGQLQLLPTLLIKLHDTSCRSIKFAALVSGMLQLMHLQRLPLELLTRAIVFVGLGLPNRDSVIFAFALTDPQEYYDNY